MGTANFHKKTNHPMMDKRKITPGHALAMFA